MERATANEELVLSENPAQTNLQMESTPSKSITSKGSTHENVNYSLLLQRTHQIHESPKKTEENAADTTNEIKVPKYCSSNRKKARKRLDRLSWITVIPCFINFFIVDGIGYSLSLFFVALSQHFAWESKSRISAIISIHYAMTLISGPVAGYIVESQGCGRANMIGGFLAFSGFFVSSFVEITYVLMIFMGALSGLGVAIVYLASYTSIILYLKRHKELATGVFSCGSGFGALLFGPFVNYLLARYAWSGSLLILSGVFLQTISCGCLFLLFDTIFLGHGSKFRMRKHEPGCASAEQSDQEDGDDPNASPKRSITTPNLKLLDGYLSMINIHYPNHYFHQQHHHHEKHNQNTRNSAEPFPQVTPSNQTNTTELLSPKKSVSMSQLSQYGVSPQLEEQFEGKTSKPPHTIGETDESSSIVPMSTSGMVKNKAKLLPAKLSISSTYSNIISVPSTANLTRSKLRRFVRALSRHLADRLAYFHNFKFSLFFISNLLLYASGDVPCLFTIDRAANLRLVEDTGTLISIMGLSNTVGHLVYGALSQIFTRKFGAIGNIYVYSVSIVICGAATAAFPRVFDAANTILFIIALGFFISSNYTLTSLITYNIFPAAEAEARFASAFGMILTAQGVGALIGAPIGGALIDKFGNYDLAFYLAGVFICVSGILLLWQRPRCCFGKIQNSL